jgi:hypothetical protein
VSTFCWCKYKPTPFARSSPRKPIRSESDLPSRHTLQDATRSISRYRAAEPERERSLRLTAHSDPFGGGDRGLTPFVGPRAGEWAPRAHWRPRSGAWIGMLTEGWDCNTVTHIVGIRPFMSQLLCEQVVGRGLRRASYDVGEDGKLI